MGALRGVEHSFGGRTSSLPSLLLDCARMLWLVDNAHCADPGEGRPEPSGSSVGALREAPTRPRMAPGSPPATASLPLAAVRRLWMARTVTVLRSPRGRKPLACAAPTQNPTGSGPPSPGSAQWILSTSHHIGAQSRRRSGVDEVLKQISCLLLLPRGFIFFHFPQNVDPHPDPRLRRLV